MKRILFSLALLLLFAAGTQAQLSPNGKLELKNGTVLEYELNAGGQVIPLTLIAELPEEGGITLKFALMEMSGKFIHKVANLEKGKYLNWDQVYDGEERVLAEETTLAMFSRPAFRDLKANGKVMYDDVSWTLKKPTEQEVLKIGDKPVDALMAVSEDGSTQLWILNHELYPLFLKVSGNQRGPDLKIQAVR